MELIIKRFDELSLFELYDIIKLRESVFVVEQTCPYQEADGKDQFALHVYIKENDKILAYLRVLNLYNDPNNIRIGRVLTVKRNFGLGNMIMTAGISVSKDKFAAKTIHIDAQTYAKGFYQKFGFIDTKEEFIEDNIPHTKMVLKL